MKKTYVGFAVVFIGLVTNAAFAEDMMIEKQYVQTNDFNKMINENVQTTEDIHNQIQPQAELDQEAGEAKSVLDFVDVEVGWGNAEEPGQVVDRRFDSVGLPQVVDIRSVDLDVELVDKGS
ncbi:MAG: hypothetical protein AB7F86_00305 [Bdellovibrionales bacterium]